MNEAAVAAFAAAAAVGMCEKPGEVCGCVCSCLSLSTAARLLMNASGVDPSAGSLIQKRKDCARQEVTQSPVDFSVTLCYHRNQRVS